jgi:hypothetical protein
MSTAVATLLPTSYLSPSEYNALTLEQQRVSNALQGQLDNQTNLVSSLFSSGSSGTNALFAQPASTSGTPAQNIASSALVAQQSSQSTLLSALSGGASSGLIAQWTILASLTRNGLGKVLSGGTAAQAAESGQATQAASKQALLQSLYSQAGGSGALTGSLLSAYA